ncbi:SCO7613 C-terminal domain-containing membrane protein [Nocardioides sp.]|uniref:SCO7613 C-terminal domain-containing membrane protein n=1 Tax=Nocardioides sp. TaxID=35761 RepID=UPI00378436B2
MSRYADPDRCPDCRASLPPRPAGRAACPACGLPLEGTAAAELFETLQRADHLVATLRAMAAPATGAPDYGTSSTYPVAPVPPLSPPPVRPVSPGPTTRRGWTVPAVLLSLGGLCLVVGALVFLAVTWSVLGVGGRTAVLVGLTLVAAAGTWLSARRGLRGAAETFATVGGVFLALDLAGAGTAGWFGDAATSTLVLVSAVVVAVVPAVGNVLLGRCPTGRLLAPQLVAVAAVAVAAVAALVRFDGHPTVTATTAVAVSAAGAEAVRRSGQRVLAVGTLVVTVLLWLGLVLSGLAQAADAWSADGRGAATWTDVEPLLVSAVIAALVVVGGTVLHRAELLTQGALVAGCWLLAIAAAAVLGDTATAVLLVAVVGAVVVAASALVEARTAALHHLVPATGIAALGIAAAAVLGAATVVAVLAQGVLEAVADQLTAGHHDLLARADLRPLDADVAAAWTVPLAAVALVAAVVVLAPVVRTWVRSPRALVLAVLPVLTVTALCYAPVLLVAVAVAVLLAGLHLAPPPGPWRREVDLVLALGWTGVAGLVSLYDPLTATAVAALATAVVAVHLARTDSALAGLALPPLVAATAASASWLLDLPWTWGIAAVVVAVAVTAVAAGSTTTTGPVSLVTCLLATPIGVTAASGDGDAWLTAYLTLTAAGAAALAIRSRSEAAAVVGAALGLAATWVRLAGSGVHTPEAYTLPLAAVLLAFGGWSWWRHHDLGSMRTLAPGLAVALVPSLAVTVRDPVSLRALLLALACAALVAVGAARRVRAPLVCGALTGAALVVVELVPYHDAVPRWVLLTAAGTCLVVAGVRWEHLAALGRRGWGRLHELA